MYNTHLIYPENVYKNPMCIIYRNTKIGTEITKIIGRENSWHSGVVGWCEGAVYLTSLERPTDIGLQLGKACYPVVGKGRGGNVFISSVSSLSFLYLFLPCPSLSSPLLSLLSLFSLSLGDDTKWPSRVDVSLNPNTIKKSWHSRSPVKNAK